MDEVFIFNVHNNMWWNAPEHGLTKHEHKAHRYTRAEAEKLVDHKDLKAANKIIPAILRDEQVSKLLEENEKLLNTLRHIATMDCYTREGEEMPHVIMMRIAQETLDAE